MSPGTSESIRNVIIIGSGPAGYTAAIYIARADLAPLVIAVSVTAGGELMNTTEVEKFPGFTEGIMGPDLMENMQKQVERFGAEILFDDVTHVDLAGDIKKVPAGNGTTHLAHTVILSTGLVYRTLGVPNEKRLTGHGVSSCATSDGFFFHGQEIAVIGRGDSALEEELFLTKFAGKVTVVHRRETMRASKIMADRALAHPKIEFIWNSAVTDLEGEEKTTGLQLENLLTGKPATVVRQLISGNSAFQSHRLRQCFDQWAGLQAPTGCP